MSAKADNAGKIFGGLKVLEEAESRNGESRWKCECLKCGGEIVLPQHRLHYHPPKDCGCSKVAPGRIFGGLEVLREIPGRKKEQRLFECKCLHCGSVKTYYTHQIVKNRQSCGCLIAERLSAEKDTLSAKAYAAAIKNGAEIAAANRTLPQKGKTSGLPRWVRVYHVGTGGITTYAYFFTIAGERYFQGGFIDPEEAHMAALKVRRKIYAELGIKADI